MVIEIRPHYAIYEGGGYNYDNDSILATPKNWDRVEKQVAYSLDILKLISTLTNISLPVSVWLGSYRLCHAEIEEGFFIREWISQDKNNVRADEIDDTAKHIFSKYDIRNCSPRNKEDHGDHCYVMDRKLKGERVIVPREKLLFLSESSLNNLIKKMMQDNILKDMVEKVKNIIYEKCKPSKYDDPNTIKKCDLAFGRNGIAIYPWCTDGIFFIEYGRDVLPNEEYVIAYSVALFGILIKELKDTYELFSFLWRRGIDSSYMSFFDLSIEASFIKKSDLESWT